MTRPTFRHWCGKAQFPGKDEFMLGTVQAETELEAERLLFELWAEILPYDPPKSFVCLPGTLAFRPET